MEEGAQPTSMNLLDVFFRVTFGNNEGYVCIAFLQHRQMHRRFFKWPTELSAMIEAIKSDMLGHNVYFCPQLLKDRRLDGKEDVLACPTVWADLDRCNPENLFITPGIVLESSPNRYQALWGLEEPALPANAEDLSRRIAYAHAPQGADKSGWDLTQLLRVPYTYNYKYEDGANTPVVRVVSCRRTHYRIEDFDRYPTVGRSTVSEFPAPGNLPAKTGVEILSEYNSRRRLNSTTFGLYDTAPMPDEDWSAKLWKLQQYCYEAGMSREEVFKVCQDAACNKFARDGRPDEQLWRDVGRGYVRHMENVNAVIIPDEEVAPLLTSEEAAEIKGKETFIERYIKWATDLGDAAPQYHQAGAFTILSSLLAARVQLPTSFGNIIPNLWFMILADTTLTRKSTAMDIAIDLLTEVDSDVVMATDGSIEGLLQGLQGRPGRSSIFQRDEFTGFLEAMTKKDYMAGMAETLTRLYDGKHMKRILRKEIIEVHSPVLIVFAGGIKSRTQQILTLDWVSSGFMPRFIFLTAETDVMRVQPLGPPKPKDISGRAELLDELRGLASRYTGTIEMRMGKGVIHEPKKWIVTLTDDAWAKHIEFETTMTKHGVNSDRPEILTPVYARLTISTLKAAILIAAAEARGGEIIVQRWHLLRAIKYCEKWREYAIDVINGVGQTTQERQLAKVLAMITRKPGTTRSRLMQSFHMTAAEATQIFNTLEQRGLITPHPYGRGTSFMPVKLEEEAT
jgi:hypothetical protein